MDDVVKRIEASEARKRARNQRARADFEDAVAALLGDVLVAADHRPAQLLAIAKDANAFVALSVGYRSFRRAHDGLVRLSLFDIVTKGSCTRYFDRTPESRGAVRGKLERVGPTRKLLDLAQDHGIAPGAAAEHFPRAIPLDALSLRARSRRDGPLKLRGRPMRVDDTLRSRKLRAEVEELNAYVSTFCLEGAPEFRGWTRGFNEGDAPGFAWDRGGRLYAQPHGSYQNLPHELRAALRIRGEPVVEVDLRASQLSILYARQGHCLADRCDGGDPYTIEGVPRAVVKAWVTAALGAGAKPRAWSPPTRVKLREKEGIDLRDYPVREVEKAVLARLPLLADPGRIGWSTLQFLESEVMVATMLRLKREFDTPALPVHDSLVVPHSGWSTTRELLRIEFRRIVGQQPPLLRSEADELAAFSAMQKRLAA